MNFCLTKSSLLHGANDFTPSLKEGVLRTFVALKNASLSAVFEPANIGSNGSHANHYTTEVTYRHHAEQSWKLSEILFIMKNIATDTVLRGLFSRWIFITLICLFMEVRKNILEVIKEKRLRWFGHVKRMPGNRLPLKVLEWEPEGTRRRGRPKERWIYGVRRSMTNHGLTEEDTRDRDRWRNLVLGEGKPL
jgi:hypothetical protein